MKSAIQEDQKHVVVVDASAEACHPLFFLLKMKNCRVSQAKSTEEVINWVSIQALLDAPVDLLIINLSLFQQSLAILLEIGLLRLRLPVLIVDRGGNAGLLRSLYNGLGSDCPITICEPATLPDTLDRLLR